MSGSEMGQFQFWSEDWNRNRPPFYARFGIGTLFSDDCVNMGKMFVDSCENQDCRDRVTTAPNNIIGIGSGGSGGGLGPPIYWLGGDMFWPPNNSDLSW